MRVGVMAPAPRDGRARRRCPRRRPTAARGRRPRSRGDRPDDLDDGIGQAKADDHRRRRAAARHEVHGGHHELDLAVDRAADVGGCGFRVVHASNVAPRPKRERAQRPRGPLKNRSEKGDPVPDAGLGDDQAGQRPRLVGGLELAPDLADVDVDVVRLVAVGRPPHRPQQAAVGDQPPGVGDQDLEDLVLARRQVDRPVADGDRRAARRRGSGRRSGRPRTASAAGPAARRSSASIRARSSAMPNGFVT